jgi:iron complex transport system substrate-binding protein
MLNPVTPDDRRALESNELFQRLEAVRRGSYIALELPVGISMGYPSLLSTPYALDKIVPQLAEALAA